MKDSHLEWMENDPEYRAAFLEETWQTEKLFGPPPLEYTMTGSHLVATGTELDAHFAPITSTGG